MSNGERDHDIYTPTVVAEVLFNKFTKQGNYSLRRPPKLIILQAVIGNEDGLLYAH